MRLEEEVVDKLCLTEANCIDDYIVVAKDSVLSVDKHGSSTRVDAIDFTVVYTDIGEKESFAISIEDIPELIKFLQSQID